MISFVFDSFPVGITISDKGNIIIGDMSSKFYTLVARDIKGRTFSFSQLKGKVVLIVNVASSCGYTPQYKELEQLYQTYKDKGFMVLGFPCNQFGHQEPGTDEEITRFCKVHYGISFPVLNKIDVNGPRQDKIYEYLQSQKRGILGLKAIKWNFEKFLIDRNGNVSRRYSSLIKPFSIQSTIEELLEE